MPWQQPGRLFSPGHPCPWGVSGGPVGTRGMCKSHQGVQTGPPRPNCVTQRWCKAPPPPTKVNPRSQGPPEWGWCQWGRARGHERARGGTRVPLTNASPPHPSLLAPPGPPEEEPAVEGESGACTMGGACTRRGRARGGGTCTNTGRARVRECARLGGRAQLGGGVAWLGRVVQGSAVVQEPRATLGWSCDLAGWCHAHHTCVHTRGGGGGTCATGTRLMQRPLLVQGTRLVRGAPAAATPPLATRRDVTTRAANRMAECK